MRTYRIPRECEERRPNVEINRTEVCFHSGTRKVPLTWYPVSRWLVVGGERWVEKWGTKQMSLLHILLACRDLSPLFHFLTKFILHSHRILVLGLAQGKSVVYGSFFELFSLECLVVWPPRCWQGQTGCHLGLRVWSTHRLNHCGY